MRGTSTLLGECPSRRRDRTRQQFPDGPAMICDASSHRRRLLATCHVQAFMRRAEVIDGADQVHPLLQGQRAARQRPASACQRRQALTERRIQPLDIRRVDDPITLRAPPEGLEAYCAFHHNVAETAILWLKTSTAKIWLKKCQRVLRRRRQDPGRVSVRPRAV